MAVIKRVSLVDQVYEKLRERIVQLKIPFGSKLNVSKLQEWIDNKQGALAPDFAHVWLENYEKIKDEG